MTTTGVDASILIHDGTKPGGDDVRCKMNEDGTMSCAPYKFQLVQREIDTALAENSDHNNVIAKLCEMGIKTYLVMHDSDNLHEDLRQVVKAASTDDRTTAEGRRCCLFKDELGRVFNVAIAGGSSGLASTWKSNHVKFSGFQALSALLVLSRSFGCAPFYEDIGLKPAYLSLVLGLVLNEEISLSWLNTAMFVRGVPSVGASTLISHFQSDWPRKISIFILAAAGAAAGTGAQKYITLAGVSCSFCILAANLGARAWKNLNLRTLNYTGFGANIVSWVMAFVAGLCFPYLGSSETEMGGQVALEHTIQSAIASAIVFIISDIDRVQEFILVGSKQCSQDSVNVVVGGWFVFSMLASIWFYPLIKSKTRENEQYLEDTGEDHEPFLVEDQRSPVGYTVPSIPVFLIDPKMGAEPSHLCREACVKIFGGIIAVIFGGAMITLGLFYDQIEQFTCSVLPFC